MKINKMKMKKATAIKLIVLLSIIIIAFIGTYYLNPIRAHNSKKSTINDTFLGSTDYGNVVKEGPYGNVDSPIKIAYIVGVHPRESNAHKAVVESIRSVKSLKYCYYLYKVNVTVDADDYSKGRMNGQLLAQKYVVPDIISNHFKLAIDVHSNAGNYNETLFVFSPVENSSATSIAQNISNQLSWLKYYTPPDPTSPSYVTTPLNQAGIPAIVYETYDYDPYDTIKEHAVEFINKVDQITF